MCKEHVPTHTPTPWKEGMDGSVRGPDGNCIPIYSGWISEAWIDEKPAIANAEFIVRAVNSHDELLTALVELHKRYVLAIGNEGPEAIAARIALARATPTTSLKGE